MELKSLVAGYATKGEKGVEINLAGLAENKEFRSQAINAVVKKVKQSEHACVLFPSYKPCSDKNPLGKLINELALTLQVEALVTGDIVNLKKMQVPAKEVIVIKQSFRAGKELEKQIQDIRDMGCKVSVLCLIAHSGAKVESFAHQNDVPVSALVYTDEINYIGY